LPLSSYFEGWLETVDRMAVDWERRATGAETLINWLLTVVGLRQVLTIHWNSGRKSYLQRIDCERGATGAETVITGTLSVMGI
jgi:hypothetical protein